VLELLNLYCIVANLLNIHSADAHDKLPNLFSCAEMMACSNLYLSTRCTLIDINAR
jgi:hypothetical protein